MYQLHPEYAAQEQSASAEPGPGTKDGSGAAVLAQKALLGRFQRLSHLPADTIYEFRFHVIPREPFSRAFPPRSARYAPYDV